MTIFFHFGISKYLGECIWYMNDYLLMIISNNVT